VLATGAVRTQISARVADAEFNVTADTPNTVPLGEMAGKKVFGYVFKTITFGNVTVTNPHVAVLPDVVGRNDPNNRFRTDSHVVRVDDNLEPDITIRHGCAEAVARLHRGQGGEALSHRRGRTQSGGAVTTNASSRA